MTGSLREMKLFVAAYEEQSFTLAAEREHATQSGVSQHIRNLEGRFGVKLFLRDNGKVSPSPAGHEYYRHCIEVLRAHEKALRSVERFAEGLPGEVVIGLMPTMTRRCLTPALARFMAAHPNTKVRVVEGYSAALTQMVRAGELSFAVVPAHPRSMEGLRADPFLTTSELFLSGSGDRRPFSPVRLRDCEPLRLVLPSRENARRPALEAYFSTHGIEVAEVLEMDTMFGTLDFVARTDWSTVLPALLLDPAASQEGFSVHPIVEPRLSLDLVLIEPRRRPMTPPARAFCDLLRDEADRLNRSWLEIAGERPQTAVRPPSTTTDAPVM